MENGPDKKTEPTTISEAEELGRLLGVIAHEIKNPMSTIKVNLQLIDEELGDAALQCRPAGCTDFGERIGRARRKLAIIDKEATRLEQILDGFLRYADRTKPRMSPVDLNTLVSDLYDFYLPQAATNSITMRQCLEKEPIICPADTGMLKQAILNLFINAQQALGSGGELMIKTERRGGQAQIQVSDTGKGISPERLEHIFEPYQSSRPDGSGLGLATVKKIIDRHNGKISVVSEPGKGTAFTISLPICEGDSQ